MADFVKLETDYGTRYVNVDHIVWVEPARTSWDMQTKLVLDIPYYNAHGERRQTTLMCEDAPERVIEKICEKENE